MSSDSAAIASADCFLLVDPGQDIVYVSPAAERVLGWVPAELVGHSIFEVLPDFAQGPAGSPVTRALGGEEVPTYVTRRRRRDGSSVNTAVSLRVLRSPQKEVVGLTAILRADNSEQQPGALRHEDAPPVHRVEDAVYEAIVEATGEGIAVTGDTGEAMMSNGRLAELLGRDPAELERTDLHSLLGFGTVPTDSDRAPEHQQMSYRQPTGSTRLLHTTRTALSASGSPRWLLRVTDVTEARRTEDELRRLALHDPLTGLPNRQLLHDRLRMAAARQQRTGTGSVGVLFLDLDGFKTVNDSQGHEAGDWVLVEVARRLGRAVRSTDTVGRLGGDEFAIVCEQADEVELLRVAARIHEGLEQPIDLTGGPLVVRASIGLALSPPHDVADLLRYADGAMYDAKQAGSGRTAVAPDPHGTSAARTSTC
jgi:diguanylate cyclase (GGDEF)-like protein/PAS domain S-box-containing protein